MFLRRLRAWKANKLFFKNASNKKRKIGDLIHADICGLMSETSIGVSRYFLILKDDCSGFRKVYFMHHKNDTYNRFKEFVIERIISIIFRYSYIS